MARMNTLAAMALTVLPLGTIASAHAADSPAPVAHEQYRPGSGPLYIVSFTVQRHDASGATIHLWDGTATANEGQYRQHYSLPYRAQVEMDATGMITGTQPGTADEGIDVTFTATPGAPGLVSLAATGSVAYATHPGQPFTLYHRGPVRLQLADLISIPFEAAASGPTKIGEPIVFNLNTEVQLVAHVAVEE